MKFGHILETINGSETAHFFKPIQADSNKTGFETLDIFQLIRNITVIALKPLIIYLVGH